MGTVIWDGPISTMYGQLDITFGADGFSGDFDDTFGDQVNGLVGAAEPGCLYLNLAGYLGGHVRIESHDGEPPVGDEWEDVVEVSTSTPDGEQVRLTTWGGGESHELAGLRSGTYRMRVSARDRDVGHQDETSGTYLVEFWPAPASADRIIRVGSENAQYWHDERTARRRA